jgi:hypothetical protein
VHRPLVDLPVGMRAMMVEVSPEIEQGSSSDPEHKYLNEGLARGATKVLFRPVEAEVLIREVQTCLAGET